MLFAISLCEGWLGGFVLGCLCLHGIRKLSTMPATQEIVHLLGQRIHEELARRLGR